MLVTLIIMMYQHHYQVCGIEYSFSTGTTASGSVCFETEFPTLKYSHDAPLVVNSLIYNDKKETTLFNGGNLYYKLGDNSYRITANGVISEIYDCTTRTYPYVLEQLDIQVQRLGFTIHCYVVVMALVVLAF
jgi:hypothetical protein